MITHIRANEILSDLGADYAARGACASITLTPDGRLADDWHDEPADLSSESAFRAQVAAWLDTAEVR